MGRHRPSAPRRPACDGCTRWPRRSSSRSSRSRRGHGGVRSMLLTREVELEPADRPVGRIHDQLLGQVHPVGEVAEGPVGLQRGELGAVAGVDAFVAEVAGDLEHPLEAADDQALEVQLGGDAQAELGVEGIGVGEERAGDGAPRPAVAGSGSRPRRSPSAWSCSRRMARVLKRMSNTRRLSSLASRSTSRWRYRVSASLRPCHLSGSGRSALDRISRVGDVDRQLAPPAGDELTGGADPVAHVDERLDVGHLARPDGPPGT